MKRLYSALALLLGGCVLVRVMALLLAPALPTLALLVLIAAVAWRVAGGPRFGGPGAPF